MKVTKAHQVNEEYLDCWTDGRDTFVDDVGQENPDKNIICSKIYFDGVPLLSEEIEVASVQGSQQQNPSVYGTHTGTYLIGYP